MAGLRVLISGASIAGPVTAHFLQQAGAEVTVVERANELRPGGQSIDIRGHGLTVVKRMGVFETVRSNTTHEKGLRFVDANNIVQAEFPAADGTDRFEASAEIEIRRGRLAHVFYEATKHAVKYRFSTKIKQIEKKSHEVKVTFSQSFNEHDVSTSDQSLRESIQTFDLVIAADGQSSTTRQLAIGSDSSTKCIHSLNQWTSWFSLPLMKQDANWWAWYNAPGRRLVFTRPDDKSNRGALSIIGHREEMLDVLQKDTDAQKAKWRELFADAGWHTKEILDGMDQADDFYMQEVVQIKLPSYHNYNEKGTVLVGDAAYAPSPISGMGTTLAIIGSYILAGEIASSPEDLAQACHNYQERIRPLVEKAQSLPPGAPAIANPETWWGIKIFNTCLWIASWPVFFKIFSALGGSGNPPASAIELPDYRFALSGENVEVGIDE